MAAMSPCPDGETERLGRKLARAGNNQSGQIDRPGL